VATIITRAGKGSPLTNTEVDANFNNLNNAKLELAGGTMTGAIAFAAGQTFPLGSGDVTTALGFTPYNATNPSSYITTAGARSALSFTAGSGAYNSTTGAITIPTNTNQLTNGAGYTTNTGTVTSVGGTGTVNGLTLTGGVTSSGNLTLGGTLSGVSLATQVTGTLPIASGGTGATTLAGANIPVVNVANTFTGTQTFSGTASALAIVLNDAAEVTTVSATAATGTIAYDITAQSVLYYTTNASANWTVNFRASSGTTLNTALATGQSVTVAFLVTQGATAFFNNVVQVDGTTSGVTTRWLGGAPTAGNASGIDSYRYLIIKTGSAAYTVLASVTQFKA
jgi:hypothetical protein